MKVASSQFLPAPFARSLWGLTPPPHPRESAGRFTPILNKASLERGGFAAGLPVCFPRAPQNLAKDAHRGRHGTSCPAMPPLRLCRGSRRPCTPRWQGYSQSRLRRKHCQCIFREPPVVLKGWLRRRTGKTREKGQRDGRDLMCPRSKSAGNKGLKGRASVCTLAHADGARRCARAEQRVRSCDSWSGKAAVARS